MLLSKYVEQERKRRETSDGPTVYKTDILKELAKASGVALLTLQNVDRGGKIQMYRKAKAISDATGGKVKVQDLCE